VTSLIFQNRRHQNIAGLENGRKYNITVSQFHHGTLREFRLPSDVWLSVKRSAQSNYRKTGMFSVREARLGDEAHVVSLLVSVLSGEAQSYRSIFSYAESPLGRSKGDQTRPVGLLLERDDGSVAGFLGLLSSRQPHLTSGWVQHMTSWAVAPDARSHGLRMLHHLTEMQNGILANFSASAPVQAILPRFDYQMIDDAELLFPSLSPKCIWTRLRSRVATDHETISFAATEQTQIIRDHLAVGCRALGIDHNNRKIVAILLRRGRGRHTVAQLIHLAPADDDAIRSIWPVLKGFAALDMKCPQFQADARFRSVEDDPVTRNPRQMFAKGMKASPRDLTRAYGEPLQMWANMPRPYSRA
jgi:hypothetical protein